MRDVFEERAISKDHAVKPESGGAAPARDLIKLRRKANCNLSWNSLWRSRELVQYVHVLNMECAFMCILHSRDGNGFIREWTKHGSRFRLLDIHDEGELKMNPQDASVCVESSAAPGSDGVVARG